MSFNCEQRQLQNRVNEVTECCICMDTIQITNRAVTECGHVFCLSCLLRHTNNKNNCPMCRHTLGPEPQPEPVNISTFGSILDVVLSNDALLEFIISNIFDERFQLVPRQQVQQPPRQQVQQPPRQQVQQPPRQRELSRCGICRQYGHNRRTCRHAQEQNV